MITIAFSIENLGKAKKFSFQEKMWHSFNVLSVITAVAFATPAVLADDYPLNSNAWTYSSDTELQSSTGTIYFTENSGLYLDGNAPVNTRIFDTDETTYGAMFLSGRKPVGAVHTNMTIGTLLDNAGTGVDVFIGGTAGSTPDSAAVYFDESSSSISYTGATHITTDSPSLDPESTTSLDTTLFLKGTTDLRSSAGIIFDTGDTTLDITQVNSSTTIKTLSNEDSGDSNSTVALGDRELILSAAINAFSGTITGNSGSKFTITSGTETLSGKSDGFYGTNTVDSSSATNSPPAELILDTENAIPNSSVVVGTANDTLTINDNNSIVSLNGAGNVALNGYMLTLSGASGIFSGIMGPTDDTGGLTLTNTSNLTLTNANTFTGDTIIGSNATLALSGSGSILHSEVTNNGIFEIETPSASIESLSGTGVTTLEDNELILSAANYDTYSGSITGTTNSKFTVAGGVITLSGTNDGFLGTTTVTGTALYLNATNAIANSSIAVATGSFVGLQANNSITSLSGAGNVVLNGNTLTLSNANNTFSGIISDNSGTSGNFTVSGGTETLTGANTYTGTTTINPNANLYLANSGSIANSSAINNSGTLDLSDSSNAVTNINGSYTQHSTGNLVLVNTADTFQQLSVTGSATLNGTLTINDSSLRTYTTTQKYSVLTTTSGVSNVFSNLITNISSRYRPYLSYDAHDVYFNLKNYAPVATLQSVQQNVAGISTAINDQSAALQSTLAYDCDKFDKHGVCVNVGGRSTRTNAGGSNKDQAGFIVVGYSPARKVRFGVFADKAINSSITSTITKNNASSPTLGCFGHWNLNESGDGLGIHASAAFANNILSIKRARINNSEAGEGDTHMSSQGYQIQANYTQPITNAIKAVPFIGLRYTHINNGAYTETTSDAVQDPLSYGAMAQNTLAALAGAGISSQLTNKLSASALIGVQQNLNYKMDSYAGTSEIPDLTNFSVSLPRDRKTLATASAGLYYDVSSFGRISLNVAWQQQPFIGTNTTTILAGYTVKL